LNFSSPNPNNGSVQDELTRAKTEQANLRAQIDKIGFGSGGEGAANLLAAVRSAFGVGTSQTPAMSAGAGQAPVLPVGTGPMVMSVSTQMSEYEHQNSPMEKQQFVDRASSAPISNYLLFARTPVLSKFEIK